MMKLINKIFLGTFMLSMMLGFRVYNRDHRWGIFNGSDTERKLFIQVEQELLDRDIPNDIETDLYIGSSSETVQMDLLINSVLQNFNDIAASYLILGKISDSDYDASLHEERIIKISLGSAGGTSSGEAERKLENDRVVGCTIRIQEDDHTDSTKSMVRVLTHEMGHCIGLQHPQDTTHAIMSYYTKGDSIRLLLDDLMGVIYLFPIDPGAAEEEPSYGLSCSQK